MLQPMDISTNRRMSRTVSKRVSVGAGQGAGYIMYFYKLICIPGLKSSLLCVCNTILTIWKFYNKTLLSIVVCQGWSIYKTVMFA